MSVISGQTHFSWSYLLPAEFVPSGGPCHCDGRRPVTGCWSVCERASATWIAGFGLLCLLSVQNVLLWETAHPQTQSWNWLPLSPRGDFTPDVHNFDTSGNTSWQALTTIWGLRTSSARRKHGHHNMSSEEHERTTVSHLTHRPLRHASSPSFSFCPSLLHTLLLWDVSSPPGFIFYSCQQFQSQSTPSGIFYTFFFSSVCKLSLWVSLYRCSHSSHYPSFLFWDSASRAPSRPTGERPSCYSSKKVLRHKNGWPALHYVLLF